MNSMTLTASNLIKWFQLNYKDFVRDMMQCSHHYGEDALNPYHLEGDVWTHTCMVLLEASKNPYPELLVAALLHDIGKPSCRGENHEKQRVHFFGHEPVSAFMSISIIDHIEKDFNILLRKRKIIEAIAIHTEVFKLSQDQLQERLKGNRTLTKYLFNLGDADHGGRFHEQEDSVFTKPDTLVRPLIKKKQKQVIINVGLPCSGKTSGIHKLKKEDTKQFVVSRDSLIASKFPNLTYTEAWGRVDQKEIDKELQELFKEAREHDKVIVDMTHMSRKSRRKSLSHFGSDYKKIANVYMVSLDKVYERSDNRVGKKIPQRVFYKMMRSFYPPLYDENLDEINWIFT